MNSKYLRPSLQHVETVFTEWANEEEGKYEDELLLLTPVAVKTELQRQHISKDIIEYGFEASSTISLPHPDCLMVKELEEGALERIGGLLDYSFYEALH